LQCRAADCNATYRQKLVKEEDFNGFHEEQLQHEQQLLQREQLLPGEQLPQREQVDDEDTMKMDQPERPLPYLKRRPNFYEDYLS
jgi:hypothetical protein